MTREQRKIFTENYIRRGIISLYDVEELGKGVMQEILKRVHPYAITYNKTRDRYETYIKEGQKRKKLVRKTKEDLEELLLKHYDISPTFETVYDDFIAFKKQTNAGGTLEEYAKAYKTFYKGHPITTRPLESITRVEMLTWLTGNIKEHGLTQKSYEKMKVLFSQLYRYANTEKGIQNNPFDRIHIGDVSKQFRVSVPNGVAFTVSEARAITQLCRRRKNIYDFVFPFVFLTGIRKGEVLAAKWEDITDRTFYVRRREECYQETDGRTLGKTVKKITDRTKGKAGWRKIDLVPGAVELLNELKQWQTDRGIKSEFVFVSERGRTSIDGIEDHLTGVCEELGFEKKSLHKMRRTYISVLLDNGVSPEEVRRSVGHVDITTTMRSYWKDVNGTDETYKLKQKALQF